jgi:bifunctional N-acetylglucosamine-1-phosphate-uridyltransferase/glucosamine-1-phosphate-acetyltransferase GlmU-like protein
MIKISDFINRFSETALYQEKLQPWELINSLTEILNDIISRLDSGYSITNGIAIHKSAIIENGAVLKAPVIVSEHCFISAYAYLRGPIFLDRLVKIGPACEIKQSIIFEKTAMAHFNYIGNSIIGSNVNFEAGSIAANHFNERTNKEIFVLHNHNIIQTNTEKFGSLVGDNCKVGANAVLSPGTILDKNTLVGRLELIDQLNKK